MSHATDRSDSSGAPRRAPAPRPLEALRMVMQGAAPPPPIAELIGFALTDVEPGRAVIDFVAGRQHASPLGTLHGGVLCDVADAAMGIAYAASLDEDETFTTLELKINFLRPVWQGKLSATGRLVNGGRPTRAGGGGNRGQQGGPLRPPPG